MDAGNAKAVLTPYYKSRGMVETSDVGKCLLATAENVDPKRQTYAGYVSSGQGKWTAVLNQVYMVNGLPAQVFKLDIFSHLLSKKRPAKFDSSLFFPLLPAAAPFSVAEERRKPEWHHLSLPVHRDGQGLDRTITLSISNGGDSGQSKSAGPYNGLEPAYRIFSRTVGSRTVWRISFTFEVDSSPSGTRILGPSLRSTIGSSTDRFGDSIQIWVGCDGSNNVASFHYTFVEERKKFNHVLGHYILGLDDVAHLGDVDNGTLVESTYKIKLRPHLAPAGMPETAHQLRELGLGPGVPAAPGEDAPELQEGQETAMVDDSDVPQLDLFVERAEGNGDSRSSLPSADDLASAASDEFDNGTQTVDHQGYFEEAYAAITFGNMSLYEESAGDE